MGLADGSESNATGLYALAASTFAIGTTEFVVGLIPGIAADLEVSIPTAGLLVSLYALSITIGTPIVSALTGGRCHGVATSRAIHSQQSECGASDAIP
jgi:predicted MFS family arabinose efflux permease